MGSRRTGARARLRGRSRTSSPTRYESGDGTIREQASRWWSCGPKPIVRKATWSARVQPTSTSQGVLMAAGGRSEPTHWCPRRRRGTSEEGLVRVRLLQPRARGVGTVDEASPSGDAEISASESRSTEAGVRESNASPALPSSANCGGSARASHRRRRCSVTFACNAHANGTGDVIEWLVSGLRAEWETFQSSPTSKQNFFEDRKSVV